MNSNQTSPYSLKLQTIEKAMMKFVESASNKIANLEQSVG
jgi:hypothetical protein